MKKYIIQWMAALFIVAGMIVGPTLVRAEAEEQTAVHAPIELRNATYTIEAMLSGDEETGTIQTPTLVYVKDKKATVVLTWDTSDYSYIIVDGEKIQAKSREGGSVFWIPVTAWDQEMPLVVGCDTGNVVERSCSLLLHSTTMKKQGNNTPLYILIVLNMVLAFLNGLNMIRKKKLFAERVETKEEAEKFAKQQAKKPQQSFEPQRRLVLDENGNFVTSDVFESAKTYQGGESGQVKAAPSVPPQDAPAPQLWWRRTGEETLIIDRKDDGYRVKEIRPLSSQKEEEKTEE